MTLDAKKSLSQNFLVDKTMQKRVSQKMSELVTENPNLPIVEIGPGEGDLTKHFLEFQRPLIAVEIDPRAVLFLKEKFLNKDNFKILEADAFKLFQKPHNTLPENFVLLSNLPFHLGSRIMVEMAINYPQVSFAVILQKEVAGKTKTSSGFTFFGAWLNLFWDLKVVFDISPSSFLPQPNVFSSLLIGNSRFEIRNIKLEIKNDLKAEKLVFEKDYLPQFLETPNQRLVVMATLKKLFINPRKSLFNNLKNLGWDSQKITKFYEKNNLDKNLRLTWENYKQTLGLILNKI